MAKLQAGASGEGVNDKGRSIDYGYDTSAATSTIEAVSLRHHPRHRPTHRTQGTQSHRSGARGPHPSGTFVLFIAKVCWRVLSLGVHFEPDFIRVQVCREEELEEVGDERMRGSIRGERRFSRSHRKRTAFVSNAVIKRSHSYFSNGFICPLFNCKVGRMHIACHGGKRTAAAFLIPPSPYFPMAGKSARALPWLTLNRSACSINCRGAVVALVNSLSWKWKWK